jgi:hypothetical protein
MADEFFNDGAVPHGGFIAGFNVAGALVVENFSVDNPSKIIEQPTIIGAPKGSVGVRAFMTATATVQIPNSNGSLLDLGDFFTADASHGGRKWYVKSIGSRYAMGDYWKEEVSFQRAYN